MINGSIHGGAVEEDPSNFSRSSSQKSSNCSQTPQRVLSNLELLSSPRMYVKKLQFKLSNHSASASTPMLAVVPEITVYQENVMAPLQPIQGIGLYSMESLNVCYSYN